MRLHSHARTRSLASVYGGAGEPSAWKIVYRLYREDRLEDAYRQAVDLGAGTMGYGLSTYRMIEAEWQTRRQSETSRLNDLLTLEVIPEAVRHVADLREVVVAACDETARRLELPQTTPALIAILAEEANTPWTPGRHGFCAPKSAFAKICIPFYLLGNPAELRAALRHEYAHVLALASSSELCETWLNEAVAMQLGEAVAPEARAGFSNGSLAWLAPGQLDGAFLKDRESEAGRRSVWLAYQQSACLAAYLVNLRSEGALGRLLAAHSSEYWPRLWCMVRNEQPTDAALRRVFGFPMRELFARCKAWLEQG